METRDSLWPPAKDTDPQSFITFSLNGHFKLNKNAKKKKKKEAVVLPHSYVPRRNVFRLTDCLKSYKSTPPDGWRLTRIISVDADVPLIRRRVNYHLSKHLSVLLNCLTVRCECGPVAYWQYPLVDSKNKNTQHPRSILRAHSMKARLPATTAWNYQI